MNRRAAAGVAVLALAGAAGLFASLSSSGPAGSPVVTAPVSSTPNSSSGPPPTPAPTPPATSSSASAVERKDTCKARTGDKPGRFYPGPSASEDYDELFSASARVPGLATHVPQSIAAWPDWDGDGHTLLVIGAYARGQESRLYGIEPETGRHVGTVVVAESHLGGIAVSGRWLIAQDRSKLEREPVRRYRLTDLRTKMADRAAAPGTPPPDLPFLAAVGKPQEIYSADFMTSHDGRIWAGRYHSLDRNEMYEYEVDDDGGLHAVGAAWQIPANTQGLLVTDDRFVFSRSHLATQPSALLVTERGHRKLDDARRRCLRAPSMSENLARVGPWVYLLSEGGAAQYAARARNPVAELHRAPVAKLADLEGG